MAYCCIYYQLAERNFLLLICSKEKCGYGLCHWKEKPAHRLIIKTGPGKDHEFWMKVDLFYGTFYSLIPHCRLWRNVEFITDLLSHLNGYNCGQRYAWVDYQSISTLVIDWFVCIVWKLTTCGLVCMSSDNKQKVLSHVSLLKS